MPGSARPNRTTRSQPAFFKAASCALRGRQRAMDNGVKFGPPFKLDAFQKREALARIKAGESQSLIARTYGVDRATISRLQKRAAAS